MSLSVGETPNLADVTFLNYSPYFCRRSNYFTMTAALSAQDQIAAFLADAIPEKILSFKFSPAIQRRIELLVGRKKEGIITREEVDELERYLSYDLLIGLAKARALKHLGS